MDKKISREYCYIAGDILDEYASSYSQVDQERLAKTLQDMVNEKVEKFAKRLKSRLDISVVGYSTSEIMSEIEDKIDEICKEITEVHNE